MEWNWVNLSSFILLLFVITLLTIMNYHEAHLYVKRKREEELLNETKGFCNGQVNDQEKTEEESQKQMTKQPTSK